MNSVKLLSKYPRIDINDKDINYDVEQEWTDRPAWIKLKNVQRPFPRFLSIQVPKFGELIYKSFGQYYFPFDYHSDEERRFMDGIAQNYDSLVGNEFNIPMAKALMSKIPLAEISRKSSILDLGCGTGLFSEILANEGYQDLTLVDFSRGMLEIAKNKPSLEKARFVQMDLTKDIPNGKYDFVVSVMLFNTFNDDTTSDLISRLTKQLNLGAIFAILEDSEKTVYKERFQTIFKGMVNVSNRTKYIFVGKLAS